MTGMSFSFDAEVWWWRGPSPFHFVTVPKDVADEIHDNAAAFTYVWGMIPVTGTVNDVAFATALFAKDGGYVVPIKKAVREAAGVELGDVVHITMAPVQG